MKRSESLASFQKPYVRKKEDIKEFKSGKNGISLAEVVKKLNQQL